MSALMHYASSPTALDRARVYEQLEPVRYSKPQGFWVSVSGDDDWPTWCRAERFGTDRLRAAHAVDLAPDANVLRISSPAELEAFHDHFAVETDSERKYGDGRRMWPIDWRAVAEEFDGIIIAPYQWGHRLDLSWYYGWDCASGCVWNLDAIASLTVATSALRAVS